MAAASNTKNVYQFKITLRDAEPPIWRQIQVPESYNFHQLHIAIQYAMGWESAEGNYHLHSFDMINPQTLKNQLIGILDSDDEMSADICRGAFMAYFGLPQPKAIDEKKTKIAKYFSLANTKAIYEYDFGDSWEHELVFEGSFPAEAAKNYPVCITGERACPPEDAGGVCGYERLLTILANPKHEEYQDMKDWLRDWKGVPGGIFKSEEFNPR